MSCFKCASNKLFRISGLDLINESLDEGEKCFKDVSPCEELGLTNIRDDINILDFEYCGDCGQIQVSFPLYHDILEDTLKKEEKGIEDEINNEEEE